ncbi:uncharacterized protein VP01_2973g3 [Puccinia sorghi]|uniref:Uncharacterized protein n=1 Tax=Puccinia sorghi TaxID=27349 RepID=A0A0L6V0P7_9BASI|nr:uncharacterized protein VP01_2973g3 [Puccinia sorghi]
MRDGPLTYNKLFLSRSAHSSVPLTLCGQIRCGLPDIGGLAANCFMSTHNESQLSLAEALDYDQYNSPSTEHPHLHLMDLLCDPEASKVDELKLSIPVPNFLIDPQDGQFTPYLERSPVSTPDQEHDQPMYFNHHADHHSPDSSSGSALSPLRSRATSIVLKKLMETQAQMLLDISAAWKKKYPMDECDPAQSIVANDDSSSSTNRQPPVLLHANPIHLSVDRTPPPPRKIRSMTHLSDHSLSNVLDHLSLKDLPTHPAVADVESWKRDALESKIKHDATRTWILCLPQSSDEFQDPCQSLPSAAIDHCSP